MPSQPSSFPHPKLESRLTGYFDNARGLEKEKLMSDPKKCGNPACSCLPPNKEKFCSPHCEALKGSVEVVCKCGHTSCGGTA